MAQSDQDKTTFTCPWDTYTYRVLHFGLCNALVTFHKYVLSIFYDLSYCVEVYMDYFTYFGETFDEALKNLEKVLKRCKYTNLSLSNDKCHLMIIEGIVLGHHVSAQGLKVDIKKIEVIQQLPTPKIVKEVRSFLVHVGYYRRFIKDFNKIVAPLFDLLFKENEFK